MYTVLQLPGPHGRSIPQCRCCANTLTKYLYQNKLQLSSVLTETMSFRRIITHFLFLIKTFVLTFIFFWTSAIIHTMQIFKKYCSVKGGNSWKSLLSPSRWRNTFLWNVGQFVPTDTVLLKPRKQPSSKIKNVGMMKLLREQSLMTGWPAETHEWSPYIKRVNVPHHRRPLPTLKHYKITMEPFRCFSWFQLSEVGLRPLWEQSI